MRPQRDRGKAAWVSTRRRLVIDRIVILIIVIVGLVNLDTVLGHTGSKTRDAPRKVIAILRMMARREIPQVVVGRHAAAPVRRIAIGIFVFALGVFLEALRCEFIETDIVLVVVVILLSGRYRLRTKWRSSLRRKTHRVADRRL